MMQDDAFPTDIEHAAMAKFLQEQGITIEDSGPCPLITYSSHYKQKLSVLEDQTEIDALKANGDHLRTAVMAARLGIPVHKWRRKLINLTDIFTTPTLLKSTIWADDWNGVWINKTHGGPGLCEVPLPVTNGACARSELKASGFYTLYAKPILEHPAFSYGLLCSCQSVRGKKIHSKPFIVKLQKKCTRPVRLFGAYGSVWVPLYGDHAGQILLAPEPFIHGPGNDPYLSGIGRPRKGAYEDFVSKEQEIYNSTLLSDAYYDQAVFNPDRAVAIEDHHTVVRARSWYRV